MRLKPLSRSVQLQRLGCWQVRSSCFYSTTWSGSLRSGRASVYLCVRVCNGMALSVSAWPMWFAQLELEVDDVIKRSLKIFALSID